MASTTNEMLSVMRDRLYDVHESLPALASLIPRPPIIDSSADGNVEQNDIHGLKGFRQQVEKDAMALNKVGAMLSGTLIAIYCFLFFLDSFLK